MINLRALLIASVALMLTGAIILAITIGALIITPLLLFYSLFKIARFILSLKELDDEKESSDKE